MLGEVLEDPEKNVFGGMASKEMTVAYKLMIDLILATDMSRHGELLNALKALTTEQLNNELPLTSTQEEEVGKESGGAVVNQKRFDYRLQSLSWLG